MNAAEQHRVPGETVMSSLLPSGPDAAQVLQVCQEAADVMSGIDATAMLDELMGHSLDGRRAIPDLGQTNGNAADHIPFLRAMPTVENHFAACLLPKNSPVPSTSSSHNFLCGSQVDLAGVAAAATAAMVNPMPSPQINLCSSALSTPRTNVAADVGPAITPAPLVGVVSPSLSASSISPACAAPVLADGENRKREMHNIVERRRRYDINDRIKELGQLLPGVELEARQSKGNILKTAVSHVKKLQKVEMRYRDLSRKQRQYIKTLEVFKARLQEYDTVCRSMGISVPSSSDAAVLDHVDLSRVTLDHCVTLVDCLESDSGTLSDVSVSSTCSSASIDNGHASEDDIGWSEDDDMGPEKVAELLSMPLLQ